ncbi:MAG: VWA domain-containing protein [Acidobacteria bacterium]|nr:VWA domain-containing protein [Acidobacteriota bacterium]MCI0620206.1 VWA domain-containing protein [Acidobacteriota bacterium]
MNQRVQTKLRVFLSCLLALSSLASAGDSLSAGALQQEQAQDKKVEQGGPKQEESDTVIGPKKQAPPKKKRITPKKPTGDKPDENFTLAVDIELVNLDVVVTDKRGNFIPNLTQKNFRVYEDKVEQKVTNFSPTTAPLTIVMVVEFARTLAWWFDDVITPTAGFINLLRPEDWAALVAYDMRPEILTDFTQDKRDLYAGLNRMRIPAFSETNLFDALKDTLDRLEEVDGKKAVLLISTGIDTFSKITFDTMLKRVQTTNAVIYCIGMMQLAREYLDARGYLAPEERLTYLQADNQLNTFARRTGGKAWFPRFIGEYPGILQQVGIELRNQYSMGYQSGNPNRDGKFRKIKVDVVDESGTVVKNVVARAKEGYQAPKG